MSPLSPETEPESLIDPVAPAAIFKPVSRRSAAMWNMALSYSFLVLVFVRNLAFVPFYLRYISDAEYGAWCVTGGVLAYLMTDLGLLSVLIQQTAVAYGNGDKSRLERLAGTGLMLSVGLSLLVSLLGAAVSPFVPQFFDLTGADPHRLTLCLIIVAAANGLELITLCLSGVLKSLQRPLFPGLLRVGAELVGLTVTVWLIRRGWGLYGIAWGLAIRTLLAVSITTVWFLWICLMQLSLRPTWAWAEVKQLWTLSIYQFIAMLAWRVKYSIDTLIIGYLMGPVIALGYIMTTRAHDTVRLLVDQFGMSLLPSLAHLHGEGNTSLFKKIVIAMARFEVWVAAIGMVGVMVFNGWFVQLWVGADLYVGDAVTWIYAVWGILYFLSMVFYHVMQAMGDFRGLCTFVWLDAIVRVPLTVVLLRIFGLWGAPAAALIAQAIAFTWLILRLLPRLQFDRTELAETARGVSKLIASPLLVALLIPFIGGVPDNWLYFGIKASGFAAVAMGLSLLIEPSLLTFIRRRGRIDLVEVPAT